MTTQSHASLGPLIKVLLRCDRPAHSLFGTHAPVLLEGPRAFNGWLVHSGAGENLESALIDGEVAFGCPAGCQSLWYQEGNDNTEPGLIRCEISVGLKNVILDQGVASPPVDG